MASNSENPSVHVLCWFCGRHPCGCEQADLFPKQQLTRLPCTVSRDLPTHRTTPDSSTDPK